MTDSIVKLDVRSRPEQDDEEVKEDADGELSDYIISVGSDGQNRSQPGNHKFKVVQSCLEFQKIIHEYIMLTNNFKMLTNDSA